jgi:hypothetical protein
MRPNTLSRQPEETFMDWAERFLADADNRRQEFLDSDPRVIECQEVTTPHVPLGWFLVILAVDIACLIGIYAGIAKALR